VEASSTKTATADQEGRLTDQERWARRLWLLRSLRQFRAVLARDLEKDLFGADDIKMETYNKYGRMAISLFPDHPAFRELRAMPQGDAALGGTFGLVRPPHANFATQRILANVDNLLVELDFAFGLHVEDDEDAERSQAVNAGALLEAERKAQNHELLQAIERLSERRQEVPKVDELDFAFIRDAAMRGVLILDHSETQRAFIAQCWKSSAALSAGVVEGMLTDLLQWQEATQLSDYDAATKKMQNGSGSGINWKSAGLFKLQDAVSRLNLLSPDTCRLAVSAANFRDTIHPYRESRGSSRVRREEAEVLLLLLKLVYRELSDRSNGSS